MQKQPTTLDELFSESAARHAELIFIRHRVGNGWREETYGRVAELVANASRRLRYMGVCHGTRVGFIASNRLEWIVLAYACHRLGAIFVPMYESQRPEDWAYIIDDCTPLVVFTATQAIADVIRQSGAGNDSLRWLIALDMPEWQGAIGRGDMLQITGPGTFQLLSSDIMGVPKLLNREPPPAQSPQPQDTACLIYTSGTTGNPKGVIQTHRNIASNVLAVAHLGLAEEGDRSVMVLPMAHAFAHTADLHVMMHKGCRITICPNVTELLPTLASARPTVLCVVPKLLQRVHDGVKAQATSKGALVRAIYAGALAASNRKRETGSAGLYGALLWWLASALIFRKVRAKFGGRLRHVICGGAALPTEVAEFMEAAGIPVHIGYGMTEASPVITVTRPGDRKLGTSGKPIEGVTVTLDMTGADNGSGEGEIVVAGPNITAGYYNLPEETAKALTPDGKLRTGDLGRFDADGNLVVLGRNSERYKLSNGEWVAPVPLEDRILRSPLISNVMIFGQDRPFNIAVIVPNERALKAQIDATPAPTCDEDNMRGELPYQLLLTEVQSCIQGCKLYEKVRKVVVVEEDFTQENGLLTPTLKIKRRKVSERWKAAIEKAYS